MAAAAAEGKLVAEMNGWDDGWISVFDPERLPGNALTRARNLTLEYGTAKKRFGTTKFNATVLDVSPIQSAYWSEGLLGDLLVVTAGTKIIDLTTGAQVDIATGLTAAQKFGFAEARKAGTNYLYIFGESQTPRRWTGAGAVTALAAGSSPSVNCSFAAWHKFRMWAARTTDPNLYQSNAEDPELWTARHSLLVLEPGDGEWRGLISRRRDLACFSEGAVYIVGGSNPEPPGVDLSVDKTTGQRAGAISRDGIAVDDQTDAIYFMSFDGYVYALEGYHKKKLSSQITDQFDLVNFAALDKVAMMVHGNYLLVSIPYGSSQTTNNRIFATHLRKPRLPWVEWTGLNVLTFARRRLAKRLYMADVTAGTLWFYDPAVWSDNAVAVDFDLVTASVHGGRYFSRKRALRAWIQADVVAGGTCAVSSGPNEQDPDSFTAAPAGSIKLDESEKLMGDFADAAVGARNGVVNYGVNLSADAEEDRGEWFRLRVRANTTSDFSLRRIRVEEHEDPLFGSR